MAKALTIFMLLAATAAFAAAYPGLGKGFAGAVVTSVNATDSAPAAAASNDAGSATIALTHPKFAKFGAAQQTDLSNCQCKDDCQETKRKVCKSREVQKETCKDEEEEEEVVECETKCFKADKIISVGKGRRLLSANSAHGLPHVVAKAAIAHAVLSQGQGSANGTEASGGQKQEICREICKPGTKKTKTKKCKKTPEKEFYDCKDEVTSSRCVKKCICGEKTITIGHSPDVSAIAAALIGAHGKGH